MLGDCSHLFAGFRSGVTFFIFTLHLSTCIAANVATSQGILKISADLRPASRKKLALDFKPPAGVTQGGIGYTFNLQQDGFTETHQQKDKFWRKLCNSCFHSGVV